MAAGETMARAAGANPALAVRLREVSVGSGARSLLSIAQLDIAQGERVAILGPNGAGKSTLLRVLGGQIRCRAGSVGVLGYALSPDLGAREWRQLRARCGQIMQGLHLVARLSARDNVLIGCLSRVRDWRSWTRTFPMQERIDAEAALAAVGLLARAEVRADRLSGGERQKVAIARLLLQRPQLILADEPTAALDPAAAGQVCRLLAQAAAGATLITVVHNPALLPVLADRVLGIQQGRIVFDAPVCEVDDARLASLYQMPPIA